MGMYQHIREAWKKPDRNLQRARLIQWRKQPTTVRIERPTRLDRARSLGYKAKQGFIIVRQRVHRGGRMREQFDGGRRSKHFRHRKVLKKNYQQVAEERASRKYVNCEALNSYWVGQDGKSYWYEIILIDRSHPNILRNPTLSGVARKRGRAERGLTSAGRKARGLRHKGIGAEKMRPSNRANARQAK
ncbi:50S ribosomal protein L15e [Candidatus Woesearchaeota archaeon]|nr:50S ribosomal protein L15e [Candidatus Woesearchaeota archaeon]